MDKAAHATRGSHFCSPCTFGISQVLTDKKSKRFFLFINMFQKGHFALSAAKLGISAETAKLLRGNVSEKLFKTSARGR